MKIAHRISSKSKRTKIILIIVAVMIVILSVGATVFFLGKQRWQAMGESVKDGNRQLGTAYQSLAKAKARDERLQHLKKLLAPSTVSCKGDWWFDWQGGALQEAKDARAACVAQQEKAKRIASKASHLDTYIVDEQKIITQLEKLKINEKDKGWQKSAPANVAEGVLALSSMSVDSAVTPVRDEALKSLEQIDKAWKNVAKAEKRENKDEYLDAVEGLRRVYGDLGTVTDVSDKQLTNLISEFLVSVQK